MIVDILLGLLMAILFFWLLAFPVSTWIVVHILYPRRLRRTPGEPGFPVNVIVPCKGNGPYLRENLTAYASQDYPDYVVTFVTSTPGDDANPVIASLARDNPRVRHVVAGMSSTCAPKVYAQIVVIDADPRSRVFLFGDSDMRPASSWLREMARPFLDPRVEVTTSHRWIVPDARGFAASLYTILMGYHCMITGSPILALLWGGDFGISRAAYDDMGIAELWRTSASDDIALSNRMAERRVRPVFVPRGVAVTRETHPNMAALLKWYDRQALAARLHEVFTWIGGVTVESLVCLSLVGSLALVIAEAAMGSLDYRAVAAPLVFFAVMAGSTITKLTFAPRRDVAFWQWVLLPLVGHFVIAGSYWRAAFRNTMTWGSFTFTVGRDGKVSRIDPEG
jgi:hypothetical protein